MSTADPGECRGNQVYPPPLPPCRCGDAVDVHRIANGKRTTCHAGRQEGPCGCRAYEPEEGTDE